MNLRDKRSSKDTRPALPAATLRSPCSAPRPPGGPLDPLAPGRRPIGVALSGGGVRAALTGLGTIRLLADIGRLGDVRHITSVSGGSILGGTIAVNWDTMRQNRFSRSSLDSRVVDPLVEAITEDSIQQHLYRHSWRLVSPRTSRTDLLADRLADTLVGETTLDQLPSGTWFEINTANLTSGARFRFTRDVVGDYITGSTTAKGLDIRVADAIAWSCAVPGPFNPTTLRHLNLPCELEVGAPELVDGGVYDNLGVDAFKPRAELENMFCVVVNAGGSFDPSLRIGRLPFVGELWRANSMLYQQVANLRTRGLFSTFNSADVGTLDGCLFNLRSPAPVDVPPRGVLRLAEFVASNNPEPVEGIAELASYPTTLARVDKEVALRLIYRGWWMAGALLCAYAPELVDECPTYSPSSP